MPPSSTISSKGQVTVPIEVRHRLGLREGDRVEFVFEDGRTFFGLSARRLTHSMPILELFRPSIPAKKSTHGFAIFAMTIMTAPNQRKGRQ